MMLGNIQTVLRKLQKAHIVIQPVLGGLRQRLFATSEILTQSENATAVKYNITRGTFATITDVHLKFFENVVGKNKLITDPDECGSYNIDWFRTTKGSSRVVVRPKSTEEVSAILRYCNENRLAVCPQGGKTGLVGGNIPVFDEIILSMELMNKIINIDNVSNTLVCEAGCVLENLEINLKEKAGLIMPLDLGAKGSCQIGGCVSTNAGGIRLFRYGNLHGNILGLEVVKANGDVINCLNTLKKDNTGYHLKNLFIGAEGTLGVVTKVAIQCPQMPNSTSVILLGLNSFDNVLKTYQLAKTELAEILSACEMMDQTSMVTCTKNLKLKNPLTENSSDYAFYMLMETAGSNTSHDEEKLNIFLEKAMDQGIIENGTIATEPSKIKNIWELRERLPEGTMLESDHVFHYDFSIHISKFYYLMTEVRKHLNDPRFLCIVTFGHLGDGNMHIDVAIPQYTEELASQVEPFIFELVSKLNGSISAEHGIGLQKKKYLSLSKDESAIEVMRGIKQFMDPNGILNPYKVI